MFEKLKLTRYKNIVGFGYVVEKEPMGYIYIKTYLIIYKKGYKFVPFTKYQLVTEYELNKKITELNEIGYKHISEWTEYVKELIESENIRKLVLENPIDLNSKRPSRS